VGYRNGANEENGCQNHRNDENGCMTLDGGGIWIVIGCDSRMGCESDWKGGNAYPWPGSENVVDPLIGFGFDSS